MSAFQSPMRVHGDNIYVRHSNLMLEVGTGVVWWLNMRTTCFCVLWRHQNYNSLRSVLHCTRPLPSRTLRLCCMPACGCLCLESLRSTPSCFLLKTISYILYEHVFGIWANCPVSHRRHFEHALGNETLFFTFLRALGGVLASFSSSFWFHGPMRRLLLDRQQSCLIRSDPGR